jgi:hypothetical protein
VAERTGRVLDMPNCKEEACYDISDLDGNFDFKNRMLERIFVYMGNRRLQKIVW